MQTFTGREYLKIDIANSYGLDKENWQDRIDWFDAHEHHILSMMPMAKEPAMFFAGVQAWEDVKAGKPIGYMISLDATSSGLQLLACLTNDRQAAQLCNVVDTGTRQDAYTLIYDEMVNRTNGQASIQRDDAKQAVMTALYGSTREPKNVFGEGELLTVFYDTMHDGAPGAWELNEAMLTFWDPTASSYHWVMPDNFHVNSKVMDTVQEPVEFFEDRFDVRYKVNRPIEQGRSLGANMVHSIDGLVVRELTRRCMYNPDKVAELRELLASGVSHQPVLTSDDDKLVGTLWNHYQQTGYLSARILDHLDAKNIGHVDPTVLGELLSSLPEKPFTLISNHDCFRCLPHYGNDLRAQYNLQLALVARSNLLESLLMSITGRHIPIQKLDPTLHNDIPAANYALS